MKRKGATFDFGDLAVGGHDLDGAAAERVRAMLRMIEPFDVAGVRKVRVGGDADGGYVMLDDLQGIDAAYSLGISDEVSWDLAVARRGIPVYQYDHTVAAPPQADPLFHFRRCGIAGRNSRAGPFRTLASLMKENNHGAGCELILKCDIEAAEWAALAALAPAQLRLFRQIVVEFHGLRRLHEPAFAAIAAPVFSALASGHRAVHVHGNNWASYAVTAGLPVPTVLEVTFVRRDDKRFVRPRRPFPTPLDRPNNGAVADLALGFFRF